MTLNLIPPWRHIWTTPLPTSYLENLLHENLSTSKGMETEFEVMFLSEHEDESAEIVQMRSWKRLRLEWPHKVWEFYLLMFIILDKNEKKKM